MNTVDHVLLVKQFSSTGKQMPYDSDTRLELCHSTWNHCPHQFGSYKIGFQSPASLELASMMYGKGDTWVHYFTPAKMTRVM